MRDLSSSTTKLTRSFLIIKLMTTSLEITQMTPSFSTTLHLFKLCHICLIIPRFNSHLFGIFVFDIRPKGIGIIFTFPAEALVGWTVISVSLRPVGGAGFGWIAGKTLEVLMRR